MKNLRVGMFRTKQTASSSGRWTRAWVVGSALATAIFWALPAAAQTNFWWTNGNSGAWSDANRWTNNAGGATGPSAGGNSDYILTFQTNATYTTTNNLASANFFLNSLVFNAPGGTVTIFGGLNTNLVFTNNTAGTGPRIFLNSAATINHDVWLGNTLTITNVSGKLLTIAAFSNNVIRGPGGLVFDGPAAASAGTAYDTILRGTNTYSGGTVINAGRVRTDSGNPYIFGTGPVTINSGGQFLFQGGTAAVPMTNAFSIAGIGVRDTWGNAGALRIEGNNTLSGPISLIGDSRIGIGSANNTAKVAGVISGAYALDLYGFASGTQLQLNTNNTHTGGTFIFGTSVKMGATNALGAPSSAITVLPSGQLDLNGMTIQQYTNITLNGFGLSGTSGALVNNTNSATYNFVKNIILGSAASVGQDGGGRIDIYGQIGGGQYLSKVGNNTVDYRGVAATNLAGVYANAGIFRVEVDNVLGNTPVQINGTGTFSIWNRTMSNAVVVNGGTFVADSTSPASDIGPVSLRAPTNTISASGTFTLGGVVSGPGALQKTGTSLLVLSNANTYAGGTIINAGQVQFNDAASTPATGTIMVNAPGALVATGAYTTINGWLGDGRISPLSQGALALRAGSAEAVDMTAYPTLSIGAAPGSAVAFTGTVTPGASGYFFGGGSGTITVDVNDVLSGAGVGSTFGNGGGGTVVLASDNSASGEARIASGTLQLGVGGAAGWLDAVSIVNSGTLVFARSDTKYLPAMSGNGALTVAGNGTLMVTNANRYYGATVVTSNATLWVTGSGVVGSINPYTGANPGDVNIGNTAGQTATGVIDSASATINGLVVRAGNSGNGVLLISNGTVNARTWFVIGQNANTTGRVDMTGGTLNVNLAGGAQHLQVGAGSSKATFNIMGGQVNVTNGAAMRVGDAAGANAEVNQSGGTVNLNSSGGLIVGNNATAIGVYTLTGGTLIATNITRASGTGTVNFDGGVVKALGNHASFISNLSTANVAAGGAFLDTGLYTVTVPQNFTGVGTLTKQGAGTMVLTGVNTGLVGMAADAGLLQFASSNAIAGSGANLLLNAGGSAAFNYANVQNMLSTRVNPASAGTIALLPVNANEAIDFNTPGLATAFLGAASNLTYGGTFTPNASVYRLGGGGGVLTYTNVIPAFSSVVIGGGSGGGTPSVVILTATNGADSTTIQGNILRANEGAGLSSGNLVLSGGVLETTGSFVRVEGTSANQVQWTGGAGGFSAYGAALTVNLGNDGRTQVWDNVNGTFSASELVLNAATANSGLNFANGLDLNGADRAIGVYSTNAAAAATLNGVILNSAGTAAGLVKLGPGTLILARTNTYDGATTVGNGTLKMGAANVLPAGTTVMLTNAPGVLLDLNGKNQTVGGLAGGGTYGGNVNLGAGTLTVNQAINSAFGGVIYGSGGLTKLGTGTLTLTNASVYTGLTSIEGGTLQLAPNGGNQPGLSEGWLNATLAWLPPMPASNTVSSARFNSSYWAASSGSTPIWPATWPVNTTIGYQGYVYNNTGSNVNWTFALVCDDNSRLAIDGVQVVLAAGTTWSTNTITLAPGAHAIDYRISNGAGGAGGGWASNYQLFGGGYGYLGGFAFDPLGRSSVNGGFYQVMVDPGNGSLFTTGLNLLPATSLVAISTNATLDLNGAAQIVGGLTDPAGSPGLGGLVTNTAAGTPALIALAPAAGSVQTFSGRIADDGTAGNAITVASVGRGVQVLSGTNTYGGGTIINNGALRFTSTNALPAGSMVALNGGGLAFDWSGAQNTLTTRVLAGASGALALTAANAAENIDFSVPGYSNMFLGAADAVAYVNTLTPFGAPNPYSAVNTNVYRLGGGGGTLVFSNNLVNPYSLTVGSGPGKVVLTTSNAFFGPLTVNRDAVLDVAGHDQSAPWILVQADGAITNSSATAATLTGGMDSIFSINSANAPAWTNWGPIGGALTLAKVGPGTQMLAVANSYSGATVVNGGMLNVNFSLGSATNDILPSGGALSLGGGVLQLTGARYVTNNQTLGNLTVDAGASAINLAPTISNNVIRLTLGPIARNAHGALNFTVSGTGVVRTAGAPLVNGILPYATVNLSDWATTNASGAVTNYTAYVNDAWAAANNTTVAANTAVTNATTYSLRFNSGTAYTVTLNGTNVIGGGGILFGNAANAGSVIGGTGELTSATSELLVIDNHTSSDRKNTTTATISARIADNGNPVSLTVAGLVPNALNQQSLSSAANGEVWLSGTNTYSGGTYLAGGAVGFVTDRNFGAYPAAPDPDNLTVIGGYNAIRANGAAMINTNRGILLVDNPVLMLSQQAGGTALTVAGDITGSGYVVTSPGQDGLVILTGTNTFSGVIEVESNLRAYEGAGLSPNANLKLGDTGQRGMLETTGTFTRALGAGPGQVQWSANNAYIGAYNNGGFAAVGGPLTVNIGGNTNTLTWNTNALAMGAFAFGQLCLQDGNSTAPLTWLNPIDFAGGNRVIANNQGLNGAAPAIMAGTLFNGSLSKGWGGLLWLTATNSLGAISITGGGVRGDYGVGLGNAQISMNGGFLETSGLLTNSLGAQAGQIQLPGGTSGFSAYGAPLVVSLDDGAPLVWQVNAHFNPAILNLQDTTANAPLTFANPIDLAGTNRIFQVNNTNASLAPVITGIISGGGLPGQSGIAKVGSGTLVLAATNTYDGPTVLSNGTLSVSYLADGGQPSAIGLSSAFPSNLVFTGGRLQYTGPEVVIDRGFQIAHSGGGWIDVVSNSTLTMSGMVTNIAAGAFNKIGNGTLKLTGPGWLINGLNVNGGTLMLSNNLVYLGGTSDSIGQNIGDFGRLVLAGTAAWSSTNMPNNVAGPVLYVGNAGKGVLVVQDDAVLTNRLYVGNAAGSAGAVYQRGGTVLNWDGSASDGRIGMTGYGYYELSGGTMTNLGYTQLGRDPTGIGVQAQYGGTFLQGNVYGGSLQISRSGIGLYHMEGGTFASSATIDLGNASDNGTTNGLAIFDMAGGTALVGGNVNMADRNNMTAILNLNGGVLTANMISKANRSGSLALVNFNGGTLQARANGLLFNTGVNAATAAYVYENGATIDSQGLLITNAQPLLAAPGSGLTSIPLATPLAGYIGSPFVQITGGGGGTGATAFAQFDSVLGLVTGILVTSHGYNYSTAPDITLIGGGSTNVSLSGATIAANLSGGMTKMGTGTLFLSASNTYTGTTRVMGGVLGLTGIGSVNHSSTLQIDAGAKMVVTGLTATMHLNAGQTLKGAGTFNGGLIVDNTATVAPGVDAPGILTVTNGNWQMEGGSIFDVQLNGLTAGAQYDRLFFGGNTLTLNNPTLNIALGFAPSYGDMFTIVSGLGSAAVGTFAGLPDGALVTNNFSGTDYVMEIAYNDTAVDPNNDITLTVVPEPAAFGLVGLGVVLLLARRRARRENV